MSKIARGLGRALFTAYEYAAMVVGLSLLAVICLAWTPFAMLLNPLLPEALGAKVGRLAITIGFRLYLTLLQLFCACRFDLAALDALRSEDSLIVVANHPSLLDAVMIVSRLPNAVCVMKAALMDNVLLGAGARMARYIRNDAPLVLVRGAREALRRGSHLVIFPEGSRTRDFPLDTFSKSSALIARHSKVPVQAVFIDFSSPYLGKAWPLFRKPELPLRFSARLGRRFEVTGDATRFTAELEQYYRQEMAEHPPLRPRRLAG